ncbi:MAG: spore coat protein CotJB [Firmicutes bacterium]|nr:spore coat protein CotJB [Bacillota bacterium]
MASANECEGLLYRVQMYGFVLDEARLYLDMHPTNRQALEYYKKYSELYREAADEYEASCGPLTAASETVVGDTWMWSENGWPWMAADEKGGN